MKKNIILLSIFLCLLVSCKSLPFAKKQAPTTTDTLTQENLSIHELILAGRSAEAKELFEIKVNINEVDEKGNTPLHLAAQIDSGELVTFLVYKGANTEIKNTDGDTALHIAIKNDAQNAAQILSTMNSDIFAKDATGKTAFELGIEKGKQYYDMLITTKTGDMTDDKGRSIVHYLVEQENADAINLCIQKKIPLSVIDSAGKTPLHLAYNKSQSLTSIKIAADLIMANATPTRGTLSFFEDAIKIRYPSLRFEDGQTPLHCAAILNQQAIARYLLDRGASITAKDVLGSTPLHEAVRYGDVEIIKMLLQAGANPNAQDSLGKTPLLLVIPKDNRNTIYDLLLQAGANPNAKDMYGDTPLHVAAMNVMDVSTIEKLTSRGADINERNKQGITPLALAVEKQDKAMVSFFAKQQADIHAEDIEGNTPLSRIFSKEINKENLEIIENLITKQNVTSRDSYGNTPLHIAVEKNASLEQIQPILRYKIDFNARNKNGDSPLYIAIEKNHRIMGELLLNNNADVFSTNIENFSPLRLAMTKGGEVQDWLLTSQVIKTADGIGNTPLHYAAEWQLDNSVAIILEKGANPNTKNTNGETALFNAVKTNSTTTLNLLLEKGTDINARDYLGNTALHSCIRWNSKESALLLMQQGANSNAQNLAGKTPLAEAARQGQIAMVTLLLDNNADINAYDATGRTVLMDSIQSGNYEIASLLIKRGASPLVQEMYGRNAYHEAVLSGNIKMIELIQNAGGNPLSRDTHGVTPFSLALTQPKNIIQAVLGQNAKLLDSDGNTPLHIALMNNVNIETFTQLLSMDYPLNSRNREGLTPLSIAVKNGMIAHTKILLEKGGDPFILDNQGECAVSRVLTTKRDLLPVVVKNAATKTDTMGDTILHYAARLADTRVVKEIVAMGIDRSVRNISGETPYTIALRWQRNEIANLLK